MMKSLYSAVSGLKNHQTKMDVIGNNISNVNTVAFKSSSVIFSDIIYQTLADASGATQTSGGVNAKQIGLGVSMGSTSVNITSAGSAQTTGNAFDIRLVDANSTNFFIVDNGTENVFTRAGSFYVDGSGNLAMTTTGYRVQGWQVDPTTGDIKKDTVSELDIMKTENLTSAPEATTEAYVSGLLDRNSTDINSTSGYSMALSFYDNLGFTYTAKFAVKLVSADAGTYSVELSDVLDSDNNSIMGTNSTTDLFQGYTLVFDTANGTFKGVGDDVNATATTQTLNTSLLGPSFADINMDFSGLSSKNNNGSSTAGVDSGASDATTGKGKKLGTMTGLSVDNTGKIWGSYDNGNTTLLGQIAVAQFANASGLEKVGDNCYATTLNSGDFDGVGVEIKADGSSMTTGELEMSNVDLASEFTDMITTQRGFQANSRVITTSDTMLEELINLKR